CLSGFLREKTVEKLDSKPLNSFFISIIFYCVCNCDNYASQLAIDLPSPSYSK
ncbi:MAG: hypothetical protein K0R80_1174, partial [Clostridia bacterium]|nr:hypothetical protein [Clostridia bacterium]